MVLVLAFGLRAVAITDSRPCVVCRPSMAASYFLLLAQKKVTKENGTLGFAPLALRERFATGGRVRPTGHPWPVVRIGAIPRAARVRCTRLVRPPFAAAQREPEEQSERKKRDRRCRIYPVLLRQGLPRSALPGSLSAAARTRRKSREAVPRRMPAHSTRAHGCAPGEALRVCLRSHAGMDARADRDREGAFFFGYFLLGKQKKVTGDHGWSTKHTRT